MTDKEIPEKAIEKALDGGWLPQIKSLYGSDAEGTSYSKIPPFNKWNPMHRKFIIGQMLLEPKQIIFSHEFAKAFWKDFQVLGEDQPEFWQLQLQQMVLEEDPIKYLEQFLDEN